jgi:hypothetical protein
LYVVSMHAAAGHPSTWSSWFGDLMDPTANTITGRVLRKADAVTSDTVPLKLCLGDPNSPYARETVRNLEAFATNLNGGCCPPSEVWEKNKLRMNDAQDKAFELISILSTSHITDADLQTALASIATSYKLVKVMELLLLDIVKKGLKEARRNVRPSLRNRFLNNQTATLAALANAPVGTDPFKGTLYDCESDDESDKTERDAFTIFVARCISIRSGRTPLEDTAAAQEAHRADDRPTTDPSTSLARSPSQISLSASHSTESTTAASLMPAMLAQAAAASPDEENSDTGECAERSLAASPTGDNADAAPAESTTDIHNDGKPKGRKGNRKKDKQ